MINTKPSKTLLITMIASTLLLTACSTNVSQKTEAPIEENNISQTIVASFYPIAFMAEQITDGQIEVINLAGSSNVHQYEPSPQDLVALNQASLVLYQGAELEPWAENIIPTLIKNKIQTQAVTEGLELYKIDEHHDEDEHDEYEDEHHDEDEHHEHEDEHHDEDEHEHNHGEFDPHTWLDPILAEDMVNIVLQSIISIDPSNEEIYKENAQTLALKFSSLDDKYKTTLSTCENNEVIASHDAFGYIARRYNFEIHSIAGISTDDEPSAKILAELKEEAEEGVTHILLEENNIQKFADTLAQETGLKTLTINPLGRGTLDPQKDFFEVMENNLESFRISLGC